MLKSMTAFGRATIEDELGHFSAEIQSVNRKHLEINTFLPRELSRFDTLIKKWISSKITRGSVTFRLSALFENTSPLSIKPNIALAKQLKEAWEKIGNELEIDFAKQFNLSLLAREPGLLLYEEELQDEKPYEKILYGVVEKALSELITMKKAEGKLLTLDLESRLEKILSSLKKIKESAPQATEKQRQKLHERLKGIGAAETVEQEERLLREVCLYAEKVDITEELIRLDSHLNQFHHLLKVEGEGVGKTLEFLIQEMNREINTIGSKASDLSITRCVIDAKGELEKIREQIQNVE